MAKIKPNKKKFQVNVILRALFCMKLIHLTEVQMPELMSLTERICSYFHPII